MPKATAVFDADDSRLSGALARTDDKMLALQSRIAKSAAAFIAGRAVAGVVTAGLDRLPLRRNSVSAPRLKNGALSRGAFKALCGVAQRRSMWVANSVTCPRTPASPAFVLSETSL